MSIYDPDRLSRKAVRRLDSESEIKFGINSFTRYSIAEILDKRPSDLNSNIVLKGGNFDYEVKYSHLIYRILIVLGYRPGVNSKAKFRYKLLSEHSSKFTE